MTEIAVHDDAGREVKVFIVSGYRVPAVWKSIGEMTTMHNALPDMTLRDDDVMLCSFPKTGTTWLFEVLSMILTGSADRVKIMKKTGMIEANTQDRMDELPSPRVLNTHLNYRNLPKDMRAKQTKTVLVLRNPKDAAVSYFNHMRGIKAYNYLDGEWKDWLRPFVNGEFEYGKYTDYLRGWEEAISTGTGFPLHMLYYEDLKLNGKEEIDNLCRFLNVDLDDETKRQILSACSFDVMAKEKLKVANVTKETYDPFEEGFSIFRKGEIGDWTNWFTVQQNEEFDRRWSEEMKGSSMFTFKYRPDQ